MSAGDVEGFAIDPTVVRAWKRYPAYKDSGVEWIGEVPAGWDVKWLKHISTVNDDTLSENTPPDYRLLYVDISNVDPVEGIQNIEEMTFEKSPSRARQIVQSGDVIVSTVRTYLRAIAPIVDPPENLIVSTGFAVIRPNSNFDSGFAGYTLRGLHFIESVVARSKGVSYPAINASELVSLEIPLPPLPEQHAIAAFLDRETARLDALVAKKQRFIELLEEKRQALISHAVTKGLDPDVETKDSGAEWIGKVPAGWEVIRLKNTICSPLQYGASESGEIYDPELPRYVRITDISEEGTLKEDTKKSIPIDIAGPYLLSYGDILFARSGATVGKTFLYLDSWGLAAYAGYLIRARVNQTILDPRYIGYFCRSSHYWDWISSAFIQATIQNISADKYANLMIPLPPIAEQRFIINYLNCETDKVKGLIRTIHDQVGKLREYRTALISAAVTGKIDVRGEAPAAP